MKRRTQRLDRAGRLACALALLSPLGAALAAGSPGITGKYVGEYQFYMNSAIDSGAPHFRIVTGENGVKYNVLGGSFKRAYWEWDFDKKTIVMGGGYLRAMNIVYPPYQLRNYGYTKIIGQTMPPAVPDLNEVTGTFVDNGDGTYTARYALQIYFDMAGYPVGNIIQKFRIDQQDGKLKIVSLDADAETGEEDGMPGRKIVGVFPFVVSPQWDADVMFKDDGTDSNGDGIPDALALALGLDPKVSDNDGDGIADADEIGPFALQPRDSDNDASPDIWEAGDFANDGTPDLAQGMGSVKVVSNLRTVNGERVSLYAPPNDYFVTPAARGEAMDSDYVPLLAANGADGKALDYSLGTVYYKVTTFDTPYQRFYDYNVTLLTIYELQTTYIPNQQGYVEQAQIWLDTHDASDSAYASWVTRLTNRQATLVGFQNDLAAKQAILPDYLAAFKEEGTAVFGEGFENLSSPDFQALLTPDDTDPSNGRVGRFRDNVVVRLQFAQGIPQGLTLVRGRKSSYADDAGQAIWTPHIDPVAWKAVDANTIEVMVDSIQKYTGTVADPVTPEFVSLIVAHTETGRGAGDNDDDSGGDNGGGAVAPPVAHGGGGSGSLGWLSALGPAGLALTRRLRKGPGGRPAGGPGSGG